MNTLVLIILITALSFLLLQVIEVFSIGSRVAGRYTKQLALGYTLQQSIFTASRFLLVLFLPAIAFLVESGISISNYSLMAGLALMTSSLMTYIILIKLNFAQTYFQIIFKNYVNVRIPSAILLSWTKKQSHKNLIVHDKKFLLSVVNKKKLLTAFIAYFFLATGFFLAFLLSIIFYENRLTLSQLTPIFHGIGALLVAFYLDPMLSRSMDNETDDNQWIENLYSIMFGRVLSYLVASLLFIFIFIFVNQ